MHAIPRLCGIPVVWTEGRGWGFWGDKQPGVEEISPRDLITSATLAMPRRKDNPMDGSAGRCRGSRDGHIHTENVHLGSPGNWASVL